MGLRHLPGATVTLYIGVICKVLPITLMYVMKCPHSIGIGGDKPPGLIVNGNKKST